MKKFNIPISIPKIINVNTPDSNHIVIYSKIDDRLYIKNANVIEKEIAFSEDIITNFIGLSDTPINYINNEHKILQINDEANGLEFTANPAIFASGIIGKSGASLIGLNSINGDIYDVQQIINGTQSSQYFNGGIITKNISDNSTIDISELNGYISSDNNEESFNKFSFKIISISNQSLSIGLNIICVDYNLNNPQFVIKTTSPNDTSIFSIGEVYKDSFNRLHIRQDGSKFLDLPLKIKKRFINVDGLTRANGIITTETISGLGIKVSNGIFYNGINEFIFNEFNNSLNNNISIISANNTIIIDSIAGDLTNTYYKGLEIVINNSSNNNNGSYLINSASWDGTNTTIIISETSLNIGADTGQIYNNTFNYWHYNYNTTTWVQTDQLENNVSIKIDTSYYNDITNTAPFQSYNIGEYGIAWVYASSAQDNNIHVIYGQNSYTLDEANGINEPIDLPDIVNNFSFLIAKIIFQENNTSFYSIKYPWDKRFSISGITDHGNLSGLSNDDHLQYTLLNGRSGDILKIDTLNEFTTNNGIIIDSVSLKDGRIFNSTNDAPTNDIELTNKKYVDDSINSINSEYLNREITQSSHGFNNDFIYYNGTIWTKAIADNETTCATHFAISINTNMFKLIPIGEIDITGMTDDASESLTNSSFYFLSQTVAGKITTNKPIIGLIQSVLITNETNNGSISIQEPYNVDDSINSINSEYLNREITQSSHGFNNDFVYYNDTIWTKAIADNETTCATHFAVNVDTNIFQLIPIGEVDITGMTDDASESLINSSFYFLSQTVAGKITTNKPTNGIIQSVLITNETNNGSISIQEPYNINEVNGEANTASNVGTSGVGIFKQKSDVDLQFKKLLAGNNITLTATENDEIEVKAEEGDITRNYINPVIASSVLTLDFATKNEIFATKSGGGAIVIGEDCTIAYANDSNFKSAWLSVEVQTASHTITFPASHKSGDYRWDTLVLTLAVGFYQISIINNGAYKSVLCSEIEV